MQEVQKRIEEYDKHSKHLLELYPTMSTDKKAPKFFIAFAFFMRHFYELKYEYEKLKISKHPDLGNVHRILKDLEHSEILLEKTTADKKTGGNISFYEQHKAQFKKWNAKTPKEKIIKTLELWTGVSGEAAVAQVLAQLRGNTNYLFDYVMAMSDSAEISNHQLSLAVHACVTSLYKYYLHHRKVLLVDVNDKRRIKIKNGVTTISLHDKFLNVNIKLKECIFSGMSNNIRELLIGLCKLDCEVAKRVVNENYTFPLDNVDPMYRINLIRKIVRRAEQVESDLACEEPNVNIDLQSEDLLKYVGDFIQAEETVAKQTDLIRENYELQKSNITKLTTLVGELVGPSTVPCVYKVFGFIVATFSDPELRKQQKLEELYTVKNARKKLTAAGHKFIESFFSI